MPQANTNLHRLHLKDTSSRTTSRYNFVQTTPINMFTDDRDDRDDGDSDTTLPGRRCSSEEAQQSKSDNTTSDFWTCDDPELLQTLRDLAEKSERENALRLGRQKGGSALWKVRVLKRVPNGRKLYPRAEPLVHDSKATAGTRSQTSRATRGQTRKERSQAAVRHPEKNCTRTRSGRISKPPQRWSPGS